MHASLAAPTRALIATLLVVAVISTVAPASAEYPILEYYVTDKVGVLTLSDVYDIEAVCQEVYEVKGAEFAVLIVNTTQPDGIDHYALRTFEKNELGQEGKDNGLLLVLSTDEQAWRIEVGYGLEGVLPDSLVGSIANDHLEPFLAEGDYYSGILYTLAFLGEQVLDHYDEGRPPKDKDPSPYPISWLPLTWGQLILVVLVFVAIAVLTQGRVWVWMGGLMHGSGRRRWGGGRSGGGGARGRWD
jgi:uncharacterized protein